MKTLLAAVVTALLAMVPCVAGAQNFSFHASAHDAFNGEAIVYDGTLFTAGGYDDGAGGTSYDLTGAAGTFSIGTGGFGGTIHDALGTFTFTGGTISFADIGLKLQSPYSELSGGIGVNTGFAFFDGLHFSEGGGPIEALSITPLAAAPVPEPASWALMIAGFGLAGYAMRRRRAMVSLA